MVTSQLRQKSLKKKFFSFSQQVIYFLLSVLLETLWKITQFRTQVATNHFYTMFRTRSSQRISQYEINRLSKEVETRFTDLMCKRKERATHQLITS